MIAAALVVLVATAKADNAMMPEVEVIGTTPLGTPAIDHKRLPANARGLTAEDFERAGSTNVEDALQLYTPSISTSNQNGSPWQLDLEYRGVFASPVIGTPQGIAVYQNGVRINEAFGDIVNWDFIPPMAIERADVLPSAPAFGLNALGGALSLKMMDGFAWQGTTIDVSGGTYGRAQPRAAYGATDGAWAVYAAADGVYDHGWRDFSVSHLARGFVDVGHRDAAHESHLSVTAATNDIAGDGTTPVELLEEEYSAVYTTPQTTKNRLLMLTVAEHRTLRPGLDLSANAYYRHYRQRHIDGNTSEIADAQIDRTLTTTNTAGTTLQLAGNRTWLGDAVLGTSLDVAWTHFEAESELATLDADRVATGTGEVSASPDRNVDLRATTTYVGLYAGDTYAIADSLTASAAARFNIAHHVMDDRNGDALDGTHTFTRLNPSIGLTYAPWSFLAVYASYAEANRAPTALELGCADPERPCILQGFLVSDPPLRQVVAHTVEMGARGEHKGFVWSASAFHAIDTDILLNVPSAQSGFGYFANAGKARRRGLETAVSYTRRSLRVSGSYNLVDATFRTATLLSAPDNPSADDDGNVAVPRGARLPSIPMHRYRASVDQSLGRVTAGADVVAASGQFFVGDPGNSERPVPGYWFVNLRLSVAVTSWLRAYARVQNLFDKHYATFGTFFETDAIAGLDFDNPRATSPGQPRTVLIGLRADL